MGIQQVFAGAAGRKEEWIIYPMKHFHSIFVGFFPPLAQACLIPGLGNQTIRLQRGKELGLMSLTSEDASSVIKEV